MPLVHAALAAVPSRVHLLPEVLASLRPQVGTLTVYLNGFSEVPAAVVQHADEWLLSQENAGAETKFHWVEKHSGLYFSCDDDLVYPADYVARLIVALEQFQGRAIVTVHGREYRGRARDVHDVVPGTVGTVFARVHEGRFVNHGGTGCMALDTRVVKLPATWPVRNMADMQVACWAQRAAVPIWLVPHEAHWIKTLAAHDPQSLYRLSQREGHRRRNVMLREHGYTQGWKLWTVE